jgi:predicted RNase H-like HicB family nuclease
MQLSIVIRPDHKDGGYVAECLEIPGCLSQGETIEETLVNIKEAAEGCLLSMVQHGDPLPTGEAVFATIPIEVPA